MGFFDALLGMFGIGQPKLTAKIDQTTLRRGALVTVDIHLEGGRREIPLTALVAVLKVESELSDGQKTWDTLAEETLYMGKQPIGPGQVIEGRITLQVPADCEPTNSKIRHFIEASADVPGWDPEQEVDVTISEQADAMAAEDYSEYHILPQERRFRNSSVRGDFRVFPLADGGAILGWKTSLICRNADGTERWRQSFGRTAAVSPDGATVAASDQNKQVALIDVASGDVQATHNVGEYVDNIAWVSDGLALNATEKIIILSLDGAPVRTINSLGGEREAPYIGGMANNGDTLIAIDANERLLAQVDARTGNVAESKELPFYPSDVYQVGDYVVIDSDDQIVMGMGTSMGKGFELPGRRGVRFLGQSEHSSTHFKPNGRLSPNTERFLLNDQSGLLWLLDNKGNPIRTWPREILDFVEDTGWLDDEHFVAITNDGRSHKVNANTGAVVWSDQDV
ncbi:MAG: sporulation protein [Myxococcota bacterium]